METEIPWPITLVFWLIVIWIAGTIAAYIDNAPIRKSMREYEQWVKDGCPPE